jgi:1-acyl-sn-glycerol-3-phosphate acyltransferase
MLNYYDRPFVYFPPKPNRFILSLGKLYNRYYYLKSHVHKVKSVDCVGLDKIRQLTSDKKNRIIFISNHPTHSDSQVIMEVYRQMGVSSNFMAAYDLFFRQSKFNRWVMQKAGSFSVDREGFNAESIKEAVNTLVKGKYHLTIFSEGRPYLQNDLLTPFQGGSAFIALSAQKRLDVRDLGERIVFVPVAIKLTHIEDCRNKILDMLNSLYNSLSITPQEGKKIEDSIEDLAVALMEHGLDSFGFPLPKGETTAEKVDSSVNMIVEALENEMSIIPETDMSINDRTKKIRSDIHNVMLKSDADSNLWALSRIRAQKIMLAIKIMSYPLDYLKSNPTLDRCGEFVERLMEDQQSAAILPYSTRKGLIKFGEAFTISELNPSGDLKKNELLTQITQTGQNSVQKMLDSINLSNNFPGGELF